jgi:transposase InsO family protein
MGQICAVFEISRQAHYQKQAREAKWQTEAAMVLELVRQVRRRHPRMGARKLLHKIQPMLDADGLQMGRDRFFALLREADLLVARPKSYRRTTHAGWFRAPNRLLGLTIAGPNQVWVGDITYLELQNNQFAYLFLLMDLFSRYIVGWQVARSLGTDGALGCLEMALAQLPPQPGSLIHHSDHGVQYTAHRYLDTLQSHTILPSMGAVGNCYDNIFAERVNGSLKNEYVLNHLFADFTQISPAVQEVIHLYNTDRPHLSLNMATPLAVYTGLVTGISALHIPSVAVETPIS